MLNVVLKEEPRFVPAKCIRDRIAISHGCDACVVIRYATNERLEPCLLSSVTIKWRGSIIDGGARDEVPIPGCRYVLVLVALQVRIKGPVSKVEAQWLARNVRATFV